MDSHTLVIRAWAIFGIVWLLAGLTSKRTVRRMPRGAMLLHILVLLLAYCLVLTPYFGVGLLSARFVPAADWVARVGYAVALAGFAFALWARYCLGRNWSGIVTVKENHTLVRSGPYRLVRHPIYSGLTLALLGSALIYGELHSLAGVVLVFFEWKRKSLLEERFMIEQFGREYIDYRHEVKALIPFVW